MGRNLREGPGNDENAHGLRVVNGLEERETLAWRVANFLSPLRCRNKIHKGVRGPGRAQRTTRVRGVGQLDEKEGSQSKD